MGTYVPGSMVDALIDDFVSYTRMTVVQARDITTQIIAIVETAANGSFRDAQAYSDAVKVEILKNVDNSLNKVADWVRYELDKILDTFGPALTTALTYLADSQLLGQQSTIEYLDASYGQIAETHGIVGEQIETVITTTADQIQANQDLVKETLEEQSKSIFDNLQETIGRIIEIPSKLIGEAISKLVPVQAQAALSNLFHFVESGPMTGLVRYTANMFGEMFQGLLSFTDDEVKDYLNKFSTMWADHAKGLLVP